MERSNERPEPYRLFFPMGLIFGALGVLPWLLLQFGQSPSPDPILLHSRLMFFGFLGTFITGFLMTAAPKMSGSSPARPWEVLSVCFLLTLQVIMAFAGWARASVFAMAAVILFLMFFLGSRFLKRRQNPPAMFVFVPIGLFSALIGCLGLLGAESLSPAQILYLKRLAYDAFVMNLVVGLGGRMIPVLSRVSGALSPQTTGPLRWTHHLPVLLFLNLSFPVEAFVSRELGFLIRAAVLCYVLVKHFRVFSPRTSKGFLGGGLRVAAWSLVLPHLFLPFFPAWELHLLHASYIGGFALITVLVAVRVVLSHGGESLEFELKNRSLAGVVALLVVAGSLRSFLPMWNPGDVFSTAAVASGFWLAALTVWWLNVGRKIDRITETIHG